LSPGTLPPVVRKAWKARDMDVTETALPGIGLRHEFSTTAGRRIGVVSHRNGRRDLVVYDDADPDACVETLQLAEEEADVLAELLAPARVVERIARLDEQVEGLVTAGVVLAGGSPFAGRTLADTKTRTRTGASIIAVVRHGSMMPMPRTDFRFDEEDTVLVVGTRDGVDAARALLTGG
jgi:TrkA domain protein